MSPEEMSQLLHEHYQSLDTNWNVTDAVSDYGTLVTPTGNSEEPFHRWFHFKEGFSHALVERLLKDASYELDTELSILDPFCGSGTTLISAVELARRREISGWLYGVERNPVLHIIASAKLDAAASGTLLSAHVRKHEGQFWKYYYGVRHKEQSSLVTDSATLNNHEYFDPERVRTLIALSRAARMISDPKVANLLLACVASAVEPSGRIRRDGRALRYHPNKVIRDPLVTFANSLARAHEDMTTRLGLDSVSAGVILGDARDFAVSVPTSGFDWSIFSPPYPNNIDYTEVYKTEAWALELFADRQHMKSQRLGTLRSHPSVIFPDIYGYLDGPYTDGVEKLLAPLLALIPNDRYRKGRTQLVRGYADDMLTVLQRIRPLMSENGRCAIIVGNSSHGRPPNQFVVASDLIIARLAELAGWHVDEIRVVRRPRRRNDVHGWLRESVVLLTSKRSAHSMKPPTLTSR